MLKKYFLFFLLIPIFFLCSKPKVELDAKENYAEQVIAYLQRHHYKKKSIIDNSFFKKVNDTFLENIDKNKFFFLKEEIKKINQKQFSIDSISEFLSANQKILSKKLNNYSNYIYNFLHSPPPSFETKDYYNSNFMNSYALTENKLKTKWRMSYQYRILNNIINETEGNLEQKINKSFSNEKKNYPKI